MKKILLCVVAATLFWSCQKDEPGIDPSAFFASLKHANISDAQSLYVASSIATRGGGEPEAPTLYKITFNGETQKVEFIDDTGKAADVRTNFVMNLSDKFLLINVGIRKDAYNFIDYAFVVRKRDGAMFAPGLQFESTNPMPPEMSFFASPSFTEDFTALVEDRAWRLQRDDNENVYFPGGGISKIYDDAVGNVFVEELVSSEMFNPYSFGEYTVNGSGDIWIWHSQTPLCRLSSGSFIRGDNDDWKCRYEVAFTLPGDPQNYYRLDRFGGASSSSDHIWPWILYKYTVQQNTLAEESVSAGYYECSDVNPSSGYYVVRLEDCAAIFLRGGIFVVNSETDVRFYDVKFPENKEQRPYLHSDKYVYAFDDQGNVLRFDPTTGSVDPVYSNTRYQIQSLRLYADDLMQFSAFDLHTGAKVIVEVDKGQERVLDTIDGRTVIQMERIN